MLAVPTTVTVELIEHTDGRPVAYIDATGIGVFVRQLPDGTYIVDICTRDAAGEQMRVLLDGMPVAGRCVSSYSVPVGWPGAVTGC